MNKTNKELANEIKNTYGDKYVLPLKEMAAQGNHNLEMSQQVQHTIKKVMKLKGRFDYYAIALEIIK